jgi:hypothetical protein
MVLADSVELLLVAATIPRMSAMTRATLRIARKRFPGPSWTEPKRPAPGVVFPMTRLLSARKIGSVREERWHRFTNENETR